ncbi:MAG: hypothetical protein R3181_12490 [Rubricoccaceae bacterium]|nr:hypothetical protein [Rubricoccaceae bacterium]
MPRSLLVLALVLGTALAVSAQDNADLRRVVLVNGDVYVGTVADEAADPLVIVTTDGIERRFRRDQVALVAPLIRGRFYRTDPVGTRFFLAPTARTLGGGEFRGDLTYLYPSITAGLSDRVDLLASGFVTFGDGAFVTPLVGVKGLVYDRPTAKVALGTSALFVVGDEVDGGFVALPYGVVTLGDETKAVSFGLGGALGGGFGSGDVEIADGVVFGLGVETQVNNGVKLFVEALGGFSEGDDGLLVLPGVRFFGNRFAFDVIGFIATDFETIRGFAPVGARASYAF